MEKLTCKLQEFALSEGKHIEEMEICRDCDDNYKQSCPHYRPLESPKLKIYDPDDTQ